MLLVDVTQILVICLCILDWTEFHIYIKKIAEQKGQLINIGHLTRVG